MDLVTLKAFFQTKVGSKTAAGSIYPVDITDCLDALADSVDAGDIGGGGAVAPSIVSATCPDGAANTVVVVFNQSMTAVTTAGWSFKKNGSAWSVSSVTGATTTWTFTMGSSAINGDTLLRSYDSTTGATIGSSLELVSFTDSAVTNSVGAVAPTVVSATCPNGAANTVVVVFDQSMTGVTTAGWSFKLNGGAWAVSSVTGATTTWTFTMGSSAVFGDTLLRSYDSTTGATIGTSLELVSFTDSAVTNSVAGSGYQTESDAFFTATGISDTGIKDAIDDFVVTAKAIGWSKFAAIWPFVGGTAGTHRYNLKSPGTTDADFYLTFGGTWSHGANGSTPTPTAYADTKFTPSVNIADVNDFHVSIYSRTDSASSSKYDFGCLASGGHGYLVNLRNASDLLAATVDREANTISNTNSQGFYLISQNSGAELNFYKNGSNILTDTTLIGGTDVTVPFYLGSYNLDGTGAQEGSDRQLSFVSIGTKLTAGEAATYSTAVEALQDALSRGVV